VTAPAALERQRVSDDAPSVGTYQARPRHERGFTLVELMIVVVIIGILAAIATVGFRKYVARARMTETASILAEMVGKEQVYYLEFGRYLPLRADGNLTQPSPDEGSGAFYPVDASSSSLESARTATSIQDPAAWPSSWRAVGLRPKGNFLYCTYLLNAGGNGQAVPGTFGKALVGATSAASPPWFYALAACNLNGVAGFPSDDTVVGVSSSSPAAVSLVEGR
jgi:prepilin-type N-terminal cleavage/methylation domain-containing protein